MKYTKIATTLSIAFAAMGAGSVNAATLPVYEGPAIDYNSSPACLAIGDGIGCSLPLLNYFAALDPKTQVPTGYVIPTPQGALDNYIILQAGGGAYENTDPYGATSSIENGFKSNDGGNDDFRATGNTSAILGNMSNPDNNGLTAAQDLPGTWDVSLASLINTLSPNSVRRELMIGFDYNQPQNATTSLNYWALITVRDTDGNLANINYEIRSNPVGSNPYTFTTGKTIDSKPLSTDFSTVNGVTCIDSTNTMVPPILPISGGQCPAGYDVHIDNAQSTSDTEIVAFMPELNAGLEGFLALGYDTVSVRMLFGCFGGTPQGDFQPGVGYLADGGATTQCESGGYGDVYLLAGSPMNRTPEPGSLALLSIAALGLGFGLRRKARRS
jgi:hypothetical protein